MTTKFLYLQQLLGDRCVFGTSAKSYTTYRAGGDFELLAKPANVDELRKILDFAVKNSIPWRILGRGSNILVSDSGLAGITIFTGMIDYVRIDKDSGNSIGKTSVIAGAGTVWDKFVMECIKNGLPGYEKTSGIPGSIGGAIRMNAGAYGQETADHLESFSVITPSGELVDIFRNDIEFSYRHAGFPSDYVVVEARFMLSYGNVEELMRTRKETLLSRRNKQPLEYPSAGSVFRRPKGEYASRLIDQCGLKGLAIGGAEISRKHAGFIINRNNASASDIYALIRKTQEEVRKQTGCSLQLEQVLWGEFPYQLRHYMADSSNS